ncbi:hypothetical protein AO385_1730 [Moraxella catarrhalis]|uniref:Uncharacterized protein n=1 Tax=Moraxella catarrhalis TaxID=480 RepID=A0A198UJY0_MORCA|nr:hypothetical protein AO384_0805 [Moraxella catarrhalis]OAU97350.1 hypothetical protein AO385_1730 [Moraxella catarrhalis]OAU97488.1 hypothetical protein AO383_0905 [Moraxella catarrhalis]
MCHNTTNIALVFVVFYFIVWRFYFDFVFSDGEFEFSYIKNCLGYF